MFWFMQKKFLGSYFFLMAMRRSQLGPNAALIVSSPSSPRKFKKYALMRRKRLVPLVPTVRITIELENFHRTVSRIYDQAPKNGAHRMDTEFE